MEKSKNILVVFSAIIFIFALAGCQNPFLQLGKEAISSASSPFVQSPIPGAVVYQDGTEEYPFLVYDVETLGMVGSGKTLDGINYWNLDQQYIQIDDIDLSDEDDWQPIGLGSQFSGGYMGNGYSISNLRMSGVEYIGLFSELSGVVKGIRLIDATILGDNYVGGITGQNDGEILDCSFTGTISANGSIGQLGGMAGRNLGTIERCSAKGYDFYGRDLGGMAGLNDGIINNSYAVGNFSGSEQVGGIVGENSVDGRISSCYANGSFIGNIVGGIAGLSKGAIINCYSKGTCGSADNNNVEVGGLVGSIGDGELTYSYSTCIVSGYYFVGGLVGSGNKGSIRYCVALNPKVTCTESFVGRIFGGDGPSTVKFKNNYANEDMIITGFDYSYDQTKDGEHVPEGDWIRESWWRYEGKWLGADWDFETVWAWGDGLPVLQNVGGQ